MKLSHDKIEQLSAALVDQLAEIDGVLFRSDDSQLRLAAQQIITNELLVEEQLDAEIHKMLQVYKYEITDQAKAAYFCDRDAGELTLTADPQ